ncbi:hypothetical protein AB0F59_32225 [Micromonospora lupini]|uniref:hypothetical protein n=1 Tax=Micromonospora lupini TaxID=285679 RepID=UPI0033C8B037
MSDRIAANTDELGSGPLGPFYEQVHRSLNYYNSLLDQCRPFVEGEPGEFDKRMLEGLVKLQDVVSFVIEGLANVGEGGRDNVDYMARTLKEVEEVANDLAASMPGVGGGEHRG